MPRKPLGDRPLTGAERQARMRERTKERRILARDMVEFLRFLEPDELNPERLLALQRRIRSIHPEINPDALNAWS